MKKTLKGGEQTKTFFEKLIFTKLEKGRQPSPARVCRPPSR